MLLQKQYEDAGDEDAASDAEDEEEEGEEDEVRVRVTELKYVVV